MRITEITVSYAATVNLGNYENIKVEASATAQLEEGEPVGAAFLTLTKRVREETLLAAAEANPPRSSRFSVANAPAAAENSDLPF